MRVGVNQVVIVTFCVLTQEWAQGRTLVGSVKNLRKQSQSRNSGQKNKKKIVSVKIKNDKQKELFYQNKNAEICCVFNVGLGRVEERVDLQQLRDEWKRQLGVTQTKSFKRNLKSWMQKSKV